ncbi:protein crumbs-like [Uloborus diversus]|uniref:protein crumbs-like n=1 Tax=Uloborus diversus TaxID=327109 RepID=UPI0024095E67|nr:protein crumbs-like [Uloborus diversus]
MGFQRKFNTGDMITYLLILLLQVQHAFSQGAEGFFNGSSFASISTLFDPRARTSLSFRTCSSGQLLYQEGITGDFMKLALLPSGTLEFSWQVNRHRHAVTLGSNLIDNHWHDVDLIHRLGSVTLSVSRKSLLIANSSNENNLFDMRLESAIPQLVVGRGYTGCILQGAGVVLNDSNVHSEDVTWGKCPLPDRGDCDGYMVDHCFSQPCHKYSSCVSLPNGYECVCTSRYSGKNCDIDLGPLCNKLEYNQCQNGGVCQEDKSGNSTTCACPPKYTGVHCETMIDNTFCDFMPCRNGGTCNINQYRDNYVCTCPQGFAGVDCELNIDECQSSPCQNNGSCTDEINSYTCDCTRTGYRGPNCEENINECEENNPCYTGSRCFDRYGDYICDCPPGFGGKNCDQEVNECDSSPCQNMGTCTDNLNSYLCHCVAGFAGINCEENIDDCNGVSCPENSHCVDGVNSFSCVCNPGYSGAVPHCQEIDECAEGPCLNGATCQDQLNGFVCTCREGFVGRHCEMNIDECNSAPCQNGATCVDGAGSYTCECVTGYSGMNCEIDINDCEPNPCKNSAICTDLVNDYFCECLPGWEGKTCNENIDECLTQPCMHGQCVDFLNNFTCNCDPGYTGMLCEVNINECESSPCLNGGTCTDLINDFSCQCPEDFMGKNCLEVYDACSSSPCMNEGECRTNIPSHDFTCACPTGYLGPRCEVDIDDCEGIVCPPGKICIDQRNSYECRCPIGFTGADCSTNIDECSSNPCVNGTCIDGIGNYACQCPPGLSGKHCEADINECESSPCAHGLCQNMFGTYACYCTPGYTGTFCDIEFNECLSMPCKNNATCNDIVNNYSCTCVPGFAGINCEVDINECASDPCQNGATCNDLINRYECACVPGFSGINCEINIDECESQPCLNSGRCIDMINQFVCNCSDTGFSGMFCENNIDDCESKPCQHGAQCEDKVKDYQCHCYEGYSGKNCETDIEECASSPCLNSALCLENSNQTLYEMNYLGFFPSFNYETASGYRCICSSGFTGANCETNIDDCEINECKNGICIDGINDYYCACHLGYDGQHCGREINECQMLEPCENGATCIDLIADYKCDCLPEYGGKNCQTNLLGCINAHCENGATCVPDLDERGNHVHSCLCPPGFYGRSCETSTTVSFNTNDSLVVTHYNALLNAFKLQFHFRTTLSSGLINSGYLSGSSIHYLLYLWNGMIKVDVYDRSYQIAELFSKNGQNDSLWKSVELNFVPKKVALNVSGWVVQKSIDFPELNYSVTFGSLQNLNVNSGALVNSWNSIPDFIGCIQDIYINGDIIIPNQNSELRGAQEGCYREEQCEGSPCHNGYCKDNWLGYECICSRPHFGVTCQYSYEAATFGYKNERSRAELLIPEAEKPVLSQQVDISFFLRTRNTTGLAFYLGSRLDGSSNCSEQESGSFMLARLVDATLQIIIRQQNSDIAELTHFKTLNDGNYHFIQVKHNSSSLILSIDGDIMEKNLVSLICMEVLYIGSIPEPTRQKRQIAFHSRHQIDFLLQDDIPFFKGVIQDFRINDKEVVFYNLDAVDEGFPEEFGKVQFTDSVQRSVVSDDPCNANAISPCLHESKCQDTWNDYVCICPDDYRGKNCEEMKPCALHSCPSDSECRNLENGFECVASAAFNGKQSGIHYQVQNVNSNITNITFSFRSMSNGTVLWLENTRKLDFNHFLHIEILSGTLKVKWDLGPSFDNLSLHKTVSQKFDAKGEWQQVELWFDENLVHLKVSDNPENLSEDNYSTGLTELLNGGADVYLGYRPGFFNNFKGCLNDVRIGGHLLSFFNESVFQNNDNPFKLANKDIDLGCILCWDDDCEQGTCLNSSSSYDCDCYNGYEGQFCDIDMCVNKSPCKNEGVCYHDPMNSGLKCTCPKEYTGSRCEEMNLCHPMPCKNGGTCNQDGNQYKCACTDLYEGMDCSEPKILDCSVVQCKRGNCINIDTSSERKFKCLCLDGYEGILCNETINFCAKSPCQNNGRCSLYEGSDFASYHCQCLDGFAGEHCELNIDECENSPCKYGKCIDGIGAFKCECFPGYKGEFCEDKIRHCSEKKNVCYNGTCENLQEGYQCNCKENFIGTHCSVYNECHESKCSYRGFCQPLMDEYEIIFVHRCDCSEGYSGSDCTTELAVRESGDDTNLILVVLIPILSLLILCLLVGTIVFLRMAKKKRATRGTYSPSRQEMFGSRVEMNHVMKPPPEERLI